MESGGGGSGRIEEKGEKGVVFSRDPYTRKGSAPKKLSLWRGAQQRGRQN